MFPTSSLNTKSKEYCTEIINKNFKNQEDFDFNTTEQVINGWLLSKNLSYPHGEEVDEDIKPLKIDDECLGEGTDLFWEEFEEAVAKLVL